MAVLDIEDLVYDVYRGGMKSRFASSPAEFADGYNLTASEREAVLTEDYPALYAMGVHPMLCMYLARANGRTVPEYLMRLAATDASAVTNPNPEERGNE